MLFKALAVIFCVTIMPNSSFAEVVTKKITTWSMCASNLEELVDKKYKEALLFSGVFSGYKHILRFFGNTETGSWTFVAVDIEGLSCLLYHGDGLTPNLSGRQHAENN